MPWLVTGAPDEVPCGLSRFLASARAVARRQLEGGASHVEPLQSRLWAKEPGVQASGVFNQQYLCVRVHAHGHK